MNASRGRVVVTPGEAQPYKVVLEHERMSDTEHAVATMREGEALIRSEVPAGPSDAVPSGSGRETPFFPAAPPAAASVPEDAPTQP